MRWAASASARASKSRQLIVRSPWMKAVTSGWTAAMASHTSAKVQAVTPLSSRTSLSLPATWRRGPCGSQPAGLERQGGGELDLLHREGGRHVLQRRGGDQPLVEGVVGG